MPVVTPSSRTGLILITLLLLFHALWAGSAVSGTSPTVDERLHASGAWWARFHSDYRVNREDPPLWLHYVGLFLDESDLRLERPDFWSGGAMGSGVDLEATREADPIGFVRKARVPMFLISLLFGAALSAFAWQIAARHGLPSAGPVAGVVGAAMFCLEPLILGHGLLVKNDVAFAFIGMLAAWAMWRLWLTGSPWALAALTLAVAAGVTTKFTGIVLAGAVVPAMLLARALFPEPWTLLHLHLPTRPRRLLAAAGVYLLVAATSYLAIWAVYSFRFEPSPAGFRFDMAGLVNRTARLAVVANQAERAPGTDPIIDNAAVAAYTPSLFVRAVLFAHARRFLPESMCAGLLFTYASTLIRPTFLLGEYSEVGSRMFFPIAWAVKTPLTTIALTLTGMVVLVARNRWREYAFLLIPAVIFATAAVMSRLNIGLRHLSPVYPFLMIGVALLAAYVWRTLPRRVALPALLAALVLLCIEVLPHRLQYIQFFNLAAGGSRGGLRILSDSNLDWGQDLHLLVDWQKRNPTERLFVIYFGPTDLRAAGLRVTNAPGSWAPGPQQTPTAGSVLAISASHLQGTYYLSALRREVTAWQKQQPLEVLGGTIYLYRVP